MKKWRIASEEEILAGKTTDAYFERTLEVLRTERLNPIVHAEVTVSGMNSESEWGITAGIDDVLKLFQGKNVDIRGLPEGTLFYPYGRNGVRTPVLSIEGPYTEFTVFETPMLGFICYTSGMVTRSARIRQAAGEKTLLSFGARRTHPAVTPQVEYAAYIGGCDGVSCVLGAELIDVKPSGTTPHALVIVFRELTKAMIAFNRDLPKEIPRLAITDTYYDEVSEAIDAASSVEGLTGVRLDTTGSRRGDFRKIIEEVRWELDVRGFENIKIYVSGGLGYKEIQSLRDAPVDGFGVGGAISNAPAIDFAMDIVSMKIDDVWKPVAKRGKFSGRKDVWRCPNCARTYVISRGNKAPKCHDCNLSTELASVDLVRNGKIITKTRSPKQIRESVLEQIAKVGEKR